MSDLLLDIQMQERILRLHSIRRFTWADDHGVSVPIEACWILVVTSTDARAVGLAPTFLGTFMYPRWQLERLFVREIGAIVVNGSRVVVDPQHDGPMRLCGAGQYEARIA
jgi:hypothetical protein